MSGFHAPTKLTWDVPLASALPPILLESNWTRPGLLVDASLMASQQVAQLIALLGTDDRMDPLVVERSGGEPQTLEADRLTAGFRDHRPDVMIGIGGGSVVDLAKAVAGLLTNAGDAASFQGFGLLKNPGVPIVAVPSTAGTGSEVTWTAVLINPQREMKLGINSPHILPRHAVLDSGLTMSMPRRLTLATGIDALSHAIESHTARNATEISRALAERAARLLVRGLPAALDDGSDREARRDAQLGSTLAGWSIFNSGTGAAHAISYPLGARFGIPHAEALTMLLVPVMKAVEAKHPGAYSELWPAVCGYHSAAPATPALMSEAVIARVDQVFDDSQWVPRLGDYGIGAADMAVLAERSMDLTSALANTPVEFTRADCREVLEAIR
jgi:alcohol dehydrogenase